MERRLKKSGGITLVALIITILIMLILVAVSVNVIIKSNLIGTAEKTANGFKNAQEKENNGTVTINDKEYANVEDYITGKVKLPKIKAGERATENSQYETAVIPKGFTVSNIEKEKTVAGGLVIYDIPEDDLKDSAKVNWADPDTVKTKYNQFVWIPVEITADDNETNVKKFVRTNWKVDERGFKGISVLTDGYTDEISGMTSKFLELTKSIYNYGGFWIGRYEAGVKPAADGTETPRTNSSSQTEEFVIQQDKYPYNYIKWGLSLNDFGSEGAVYLCSNLYNNSSYGVKSMLCTGAAWDSMLTFLNDEGHLVYSSYNWGNFFGANGYTITRGSYALHNSYYYGSDGTLGEFVEVNGSYTLEGRLLLSTGATERNSNKNLYDVAGNCYEWTTENNNDDVVLRGGRNYQRYGSEARASNRTCCNLDGGPFSGFRPILFVCNPNE